MGDRLASIVERLRDAWGDCHCGTAPLLEAAAEIERLLALHVAAAARAELAQIDNARLRAALVPLLKEGMVRKGGRNTEFSERPAAPPGRFMPNERKPQAMTRTDELQEQAEYWEAKCQELRAEVERLLTENARPKEADADMRAEILEPQP
jgi:hypothetical protein